MVDERVGRYESCLPKGLLEQYRASQSDEELLALRECVSLIDARLADMLRRVKSGESGRRWRALLRAVKDLPPSPLPKGQGESDGTCSAVQYPTEVGYAEGRSKDRSDGTDPELVADCSRALRVREEAIGKIVRLCREGAADYAAWDEVRDLMEQRRRLVATEQRRLTAMSRILTAEQAVGLLGSVLEVIKRHVQDSGTLYDIAREFGELVDAGAGGGPERRG